MLNTRNIVITVNIYHRLNVCDFWGPAKFSSSIHSTMQSYLLIAKKICVALPGVHRG